MDICTHLPGPKKACFWCCLILLQLLAAPVFTVERDVIVHYTTPVA